MTTAMKVSIRPARIPGLNCPKFTACDEIAMERVLREPDPVEESDAFGTRPSRPQGSVGRIHENSFQPFGRTPTKDQLTFGANEVA